MTLVTPQITLDFSNIDDAGLLFARVARASVELSEGAELVASDGEGHECNVRVARVEGAVAYMVPDWDTWRTVPVARSAIGAMVGGFRDIPAAIVGNGNSAPSVRSANLVPSL